MVEIEITWCVKITFKRKQNKNFPNEKSTQIFSNRNNLITVNFNNLIKREVLKVIKTTDHYFIQRIKIKQFMKMSFFIVKNLITSKFK